MTELTGIFLTQYEPWAWFREGAGYWSIVSGIPGRLTWSRPAPPKARSVRHARFTLGLD